MKTLIEIYTIFCHEKALFRLYNSFNVQKVTDEPNPANRDKF